MNVLREWTTVTWTMPTAPTPLVASPALVSLDSLVMELTAQVSSSSVHLIAVVRYLLTSQILVSVVLVLTTAIQMPHVLTLMAALSAAVIQDSLEVGLIVLVRYNIKVYCVDYTCE